MAKKTELVTVDYRSIMAIPPSVRSQMAARGNIDPLLGVLTPGQRVALFPNYFKDNLSGLAGQRSEFGGIPTSRFSSGITPTSPRTGNITSVDSSVIPEVAPTAPKVTTGSFGSDTKQKAGNLVLKLQKDLGLTKTQAAAVAGNFMHESGGFKHMQEISPTAGRGGYGWAQWTGPRRKNFEAYVAANGLDARSDEANYGFFIHEISNDPYEKAQFQKWKETPYESVDSAAMGFDKYYERSGVKSYESRIEYAKQASLAADEIQATQSAIPLEGPGFVADDTKGIGDATAAPLGVVAAGSVGEILDGTPVSAAQQAVDRSLEALGLNERENKDLLKDYLSGKNLDPEKTAWCANFVNTSLAAAGLRGTGSDIANSFQNYGAGIEFNSMTKGDIIVDTNSRRADETGGHVMQATGRSRINEKTGELEFEVVGGNQSDAVTTKYISQKPDIMVRRSTEANLVQPPVAQAAPGITTAPEQPVATQTETASPAAVTQASMEPKEDGLNIADVAFGALSLSGKMLTGVPGALASMTTPAGAGEDELTAKMNAEWAAKTEAEKDAEIKRKLGTKITGSGVATNSMAAGGMIAEPHTAINDRTGERTRIGEKGTGGEYIVPKNKVNAAELGQQPYQMPAPAPQTSQIESKEAIGDKAQQVQLIQKINATGQQAPSMGSIMPSHPVAPPSARKAYADAGLESRFNNFSPLGTQYRSFGA